MDEEELLKALISTSYLMLDLLMKNYKVSSMMSNSLKMTDDVEKAIEEMDEPRAKLGEIWQLGDHRLLVGDSTNEKLVTKLMGEAKHLIYLDPPYNIGLSYDKGIGSGRIMGQVYS